MATTSWGFTNTTDSTKTVTLKKLDEFSSYAKITDEPTYAELSNKTSPLNQREILSFRCDRQNVNTAALAYPDVSRDGVFYVSKLKDILRVTDGTEISDHPIEAYLSIKHDTAYNWSNEEIEVMLLRLLGSLWDETNSKWRFEDLMRSALVPVNN
jgi:hypothetical protein